MISNVIVNNFSFLMQGLLVTLKVSFISIILSVTLGLFLGVLRFSKIPLLSFFISLFVDLTRTIPLILYIIFIHFTISPYLFGYSAFLKYIGIDSLEMYSAIVALVLFTSAYIAEIIRSGLESVEKDQILAAQALALNKSQVIEYVILPQAFSYIRPALTAQVVTLIKDTSLASAIGLIELTRACEIVYETSYHEFEVLGFAACLYVFINFLVQRIFNPKIKC